MIAAGRSLVLATLLATAVAAADQVRRERVEFPDGSGTAKVEGTVRGYEIQSSTGYRGRGTADDDRTHLGQRLDLLQPITRQHLQRSTAVHVAARDGLDYRARSRPPELHDRALPVPRRRPASRAVGLHALRWRSPARRPPARGRRAGSGHQVPRDGELRSRWGGPSDDHLPVRRGAPRPAAPRRST